MMATALSWQPQLPSRIHRHRSPFIDGGTAIAFQYSFGRQGTCFSPIPFIHAGGAHAFQRNDFSRFAKDAWRTANDSFEQILFEAKKTAEHIDRRCSVSRRVSAIAQSASYRARDIDRELEISVRWRAFTMGFSRNWPRYRKQLNDFSDTPLGKSSITIFFLWFALSGWMFRFLIFATWILPFAGPLLIGTLANNLVIKGTCPACRRQFIGQKNQMIRCGGCGNIVWQPKGDFSPRGGKGTNPSKPDPDIIDVDFEER